MWLTQDIYNRNKLLKQLWHDFWNPEKLLLILKLSCLTLIWSEKSLFFYAAGLFWLDVEVELFNLSVNYKRVTSASTFSGVIFQLATAKFGVAVFSLSVAQTNWLCYIFDYFIWKHHNLFPVHMLIMLHPQTANYISIRQISISF